MVKNELEKTFKESFKDLMIDNEFTVENIKRSADMLYSYILKSEELEKVNQELKEDFLKPIGFICRTKEKAMLQNQKLIYLANKYNLPITIIDSETNNKCRKLEKALEIIKNKKVNVDALSNCYFLCEYNEAMDYTYNEIANNFFLTQEEFDFLKEVLE